MERPDEQFFTPSGYKAQNHRKLTESMEDYLEMICRASQTEGYVRIHYLAERLNVTPSSASKMVSNLKALGLVDFQRYGIIKPSEKGWAVGNYLLYRHDVLIQFFQVLNHSAEELKQVEQVEHYLEEKTVKNLELLTHFLKNSPSFSVQPKGGTKTGKGNIK